MRLIRMSSPDVGLITSACICLIIAAAAQTFVPHYIGNAVQSAIDDDTASFNFSIIFLSVSAVLTSIFSGLRGSQFIVVVARLQIRLREMLFSRILDQDMVSGIMV